MIKRIIKSILCLAICFVLFGTSLTAMAKETVTPSTKNYGLDLQGAKNVYLCNKVPVDLKVGSKFFLTYTVTKIESDLSTQHGVIISRKAGLEYPYIEGTMQYVSKSILLKSNTTYFYRFEMTEDGLKCTAGWAKGDDSDYIGFSQTYGEIQEDCKYFGVWLGGNVDTNMVGRLTRVRCYDENGKDLGVQVGGGVKANAMVYDPVERAAMKPNNKIKNKYSITLKDNYNVLISNKKYTDSDVVYMEYTVKSVSQDKLWQSGMIYNSNPLVQYTSGVWRNEEHDKENYQGCRLLIPGVTYWIRYTVTDEGVDVVLKYNYKGEDVYYYYPRTWGEKTPGCGFFSLWFGEGPNAKVSAELVNFKCYDKNGKSLGVQVNQEAKVVHQGGLEDYSQCLAAYYNEDKDSIIWLNDKQKVSVINGDDVVSGTYVIDESVLKITAKGKTEKYKYLYKYIQDSEGNKYNRLKDNTVRFVSGLVSGEDIEKITVSHDTGYKAYEPETPVMEGNTFVAWCYADGTEYDFDKVVTESTTLYAKWKDGEGNVFLAVDAENETIDLKWGVIIGSCAFLICLTTAGSYLIIKKRKIGEGK